MNNLVFRLHWLRTAALALLLVSPASSNVLPLSFETTIVAGESAEQPDVVVQLPPVAPAADIMFSFDLTGSMEGILNATRQNALQITQQLTELGSDIRFGVSSYMDYPSCYNSYGYVRCYGNSDSGDYPYRLDQPITSELALVFDALEGLVLGHGGDGPENYTRQFFEAYANPAVGFRPGARRILLNFADSVPHDNNINWGALPVVRSTGGDPGRDQLMFTGDDLDLQAVLAEMAAQQVMLLEAHTEDRDRELWEYWTQLTGGAFFIASSETVIDDIVGAVRNALTQPDVEDLRLKAGTGYETWLVSSAPVSYSGPTGVSVAFRVTLRVPPNTPAGDYSFPLIAVDGGGLTYGEQQVTIHVPAASQDPGDPSAEWKLMPARGGWAHTLTGWAGYLREHGQPITATPGILHIVPGPNWSNFVLAAREGIPYTVKNVSLRKQSPTITQCQDFYPAHEIVQQGTANIRLWWPLLYEVPGTTWTLNILYGTASPVQLPGESSPRYAHVEEWEWELTVDVRGVMDMVEVFHQIPHGKSQTPVISSEVLYAELKAKLADAAAETDAYRIAQEMAEFELVVADACIYWFPPLPVPDGPETGISMSEENPACCALLAAADYIFFQGGVGQPVK